MAKRITLTEWDLALARQLATLRQSMNRLAEVPSSSSGWEDELSGLLGEIAFSRCYNLHHDLTFNPRSGGTDFNLPDGRTLDVKTAKKDHHRLLVPSCKQEENRKSDLYFLVTGTFPHFTMKGYATHEEVFANPINDVPDPCFGLAQSKLRQFGQ